MFKGFGKKYPEYEVILPQSHKSFTVRSLTVREEEHMKGSFVTIKKVTDHLNKCLWNCIVLKPEEITDYNSFLKNVTIIDREALLYGLYHISYGEIRNYTVTCSDSNCGHQFNVTVPASDTFNFTAYPKEDIFDRKIKIDLPVMSEVCCFIKQPTLFDEELAMKSLNGRSDASVLSIYIDHFECILPDGNTIEYSDRQDIYDAYKNLTARDRMKIEEVCRDEFTKYGIDLKMKITCPKCQNSDIINIDISEQFFRSIFTS